MELSMRFDEVVVNGSHLFTGALSGTLTAVTLTSGGAVLKDLDGSYYNMVNNVKGRTFEKYVDGKWELYRDEADVAKVYQATMNGITHNMGMGYSILVTTAMGGFEAGFLENSAGRATLNVTTKVASGVANTSAKGFTAITKNSVILGYKVTNHAWRKSGLGRGATEELISGVITVATKAGTVITETGTGQFAGNVIKVFEHNGVKVAVDETRKLIMSIRPLKGFKLP